MFRSYSGHLVLPTEQRTPGQSSDGQQLNGWRILQWGVDVPSQLKKVQQSLLLTAYVHQDRHIDSTTSFILCDCHGRMTLE